MLSCARREESTTAPQTLSLLNGAFTMKQARRLAAALRDSSDAIPVAWRAALIRDPNESEIGMARRFLEKQTSELKTREAALAELARSLFNVNEFLYID